MTTAAPAMDMDVAEQSYSAPAAAGAPAAPQPGPPVYNAKAKSESEPAPASDVKRDPSRDSTGSEDHQLSLIYDARVELGVFETEATIDAAEALARDSGGYVVHRNDRSVVFRVPTAKFQTILAASLKLGDVLHREVSVRDVTEEFRDLRIRLRNAEAMRERLEQLLARADKVDQALQVEHELERIAGEIELIKGKLAMLQELTAFSTITLAFSPRPIDIVNSRVRLPFPWLDQLGLPELLSL